ncbi:MAG: hypothetical protein DRG39_01030 [Deltaproteobacteria bacterium]|nr:MAG: hypothetical protein DRG39_01030 [Deltaproteobacteria bacterium]
MKRLIKWASITIGILIVLSIIALLVIPNFIDLNKYKPMIEKNVTKAIHRPFAIRGGLKLRLFPVAALSFSDLHIGNPKGFKEQDFASLKSFDVQIKLIPLLLSKDLQVKRFVVKDPRLTLIKKKDGKVNWEFQVAKKNQEKLNSKAIESKRKEVELKKGSKPVSAITMPLTALSVDEFSVTNGAITWIDRLSGQKKGITGITLRLKDISFTKPIDMELTAKVEGNPVIIKGKIGPLGKRPGEGITPISLHMKAFKQLKLSIKGKIKDLASQVPQYDMDLNIDPFSPKRLLSQFGDLPFRTTDPNVLQRFALSAHIKGTPESVSIGNGLLTLDQSRINFSLHAKEFKKPCIAFNIKLDKIDLDRYMPVSGSTKKRAIKSSTKGMKETKGVASRPGKKGKTRAAIDYTPLRRLEMDGHIRISKLIAKRAVFKNIYAKLTAKNGILKVNPLKIDMYQGKMLLNAGLDVRESSPVTKVALDIKNVLIGKMIKDVMRTELLNGIFNMKASLKTKGDTPEAIISSLNGTGELLIKDGSIIGIDLNGMIQNVKAAFGFGKARKLERKTVFSEIRSRFTIKNGVFHTKDSHLLSPVLKVSSTGDANLTKKTLNFRITPEYIKNPEEPITVPVIVAGTFSSPRFMPDLTGITKKMIFQTIFQKKKGEKKEKKGLEDVGKELLRGLFGH